MSLLRAWTHAAAILLALGGAAYADVLPPGGFPPPNPCFTPGYQAEEGPKMPPDDSPDHPRGKVVSFTNEEDGSLTLVIQFTKGNTQQIKVGMTGHVLGNPSDNQAIPKGEFRISKVLNATRVVGTMPPGQREWLSRLQRRVVIHLVRFPAG